jgi:hypothetical protein
MSLYNKDFFNLFYKNNKNLLASLDKFKNINIHNEYEVLNKMKLTKKDIKYIHKRLYNTNSENILNFEKNNLTLFSGKCYDNMETYKGTISTVTNNLTNKLLEKKQSNISALFSNTYFNCNKENKYKRVIIYNNIYNTTLLNFTTNDYSGRKYFRYLLTILILGNDYKFNINKNQFHSDGTLAQEIIYYFLEVYCYDRYNFFKNLSVNDYNNNTLNTLDNLNELFSNKIWIDEYPPIDGIIYLDFNSKDINYGIEIVIFINEFNLKEKNSIYINDGENFKEKKDEVTNFNPEININFKELDKKINNLYPPNILNIIEGGNYYHNKYNKYYNKYFNKLNSFQ